MHNPAIVITLFLASHFASQGFSQTTTLSFTADDTLMIANPERGFIGKCYPVWTEPPTATRALTQADCDRVKAKLYSVIGMRYCLWPWRTQDLSPQLLAQIKNDCDLARQNGLKLNLDFAYMYATNGGINAYYDGISDAPENWVLRHIDQLTTNGGANNGPLLVSNDVIAYWNIGFIGSWGEEHHSSNNLLQDNPGTYATLNAASYNIWNALLTKIPTNRQISTRYCAFKKQYAKDLPMDSSTSGNVARIGIHDYSFSGNVDNFGSFQFYAGGMARVNELRAYCSNENKYTVSAGETYGADSSLHKQQNGDTVISEMRYFDLDFYNGEFDQLAAYAETYDKWQQQGLLNKMKNFVGYRLHILSATAPAAMAAGATATLSFKIENRGWGKIFNPRPVKLMLCKKNGNVYAEKFTLNTPINPRRWYSESQKDEAFSFTVPGLATPGNYDLFLQMPDEYASLSGNSAYSIRIPSKHNGTDIWNAALGANWIGSLTVTGATGVKRKAILSSPRSKNQDLFDLAGKRFYKQAPKDCLLLKGK